MIKNKTITGWIDPKECNVDKEAATFSIHGFTPYNKTRPPEQNLFFDKSDMEYVKVTIEYLEKKE